MKKTITVLAAALLTIGSPAAAFDDEPDPADIPPTSGPYSHISIYYNQAGMVVGWDIYYCDGSTERVRYPGENLWTIQIATGSCLPPLP